MHLFCDGVSDRAADAAADNADLLEPVHLGRAAEGADEVGDIVALLNGVEHLRGAAGGLHHDGDGALFSVPARYGDGDTLALLIQTEDDELTRLRMLCDKRSFDLEQADSLCLVQKALGYYLIHLSTSIY